MGPPCLLVLLRPRAGRDPPPGRWPGVALPLQVVHLVTGAAHRLVEALREALQDLAVGAGPHPARVRDLDAFVGQIADLLVPARTVHDHRYLLAVEPGGGEADPARVGLDQGTGAD